MLGFSLLMSNNEEVFTPLSVEGLHSYYVSDVCTHTASTVSVVPDQSGNGETSMTVAGSSPLYTASDADFNGLPSFGSVTAARRLQATFASSLAQPSTYYLVMKVVSNPGYVYWRSNQGNFTDSGGLYMTPSLEPVMIVADSSLAISAATPIAAGVYVSCAIYNYGGVSAFYLNNSASAHMTSPSQGNLDGNSNACMTIGTVSSETYTWTAAAQYSGAHDADTRQQLMAYFGAKYGITTT